MQFRNLDGRCIERVLSFLPKREIPIFGEVFPYLQESINAYWKQIHVARLGEMTGPDVTAFLQNMHLCENIKELKLMKGCSEKALLLILESIEHHNAALEILDFSNVPLTADVATFLRSCHNLKSLTVSISPDGDDYPLRDLFSDETQLKHLRLRKAPSIRREEAHDPSLSFLEAIVATQTSLKTLVIGYGNDDILVRLFSNNQELEDVTIEELDKTEVVKTCLKHLPTCLKRLDVFHCSNIDVNVLMSCLAGLNLDYLRVSMPDDTAMLMDNLRTVAPTLQHLTMNCAFRDIKPYGYLQEHNNLKTLRLLNVNGQNTEILMAIIESCINLESLELKGKLIALHSELFAFISLVRTLKKITVFDEYHEIITDYSASMLELSRSESLEAAALTWSCCRCSEEAVLTLITGSNILTYLELTGNIYTGRIIRDIKEVIGRQENRRSVLNINFDRVRLSAEEIPEVNKHPLLKVKIANYK